VSLTRVNKPIRDSPLRKSGSNRNAAIKLRQVCLSANGPYFEMAKLANHLSNSQSHRNVLSVGRRLPCVEYCLRISSTELLRKKLLKRTIRKRILGKVLEDW
jgi:hypothetical protein